MTETAILSSRKDYLNIGCTRNEKNTSLHIYNCGGYALRTYSWYRPSNTQDEDSPWHHWEDERDNYITKLVDADFSKEELECSVLARDIEYMLSDFKGTLRVVKAEEDLSIDEELIAYRLFINVEEDSYEIDQDFHFKVLRDGIWMHKMGGTEIEECDDPFTDSWEEGKYCGLVYTSDICLLAHKITDKNLIFL